MTFSAPTLADARSAFEQGDRDRAKQILIALVRSPGGHANGEAWWLLTQALDDPDQQADCRRRALAAGYAPGDSSAPAGMPAGGSDAAASGPGPANTPADQAAPMISSHLDGEFKPAIDFVIQKLSENMDRYELIQAVMLRQGWTYEKARLCVDYVAVNYHQRIHVPSAMLAIGGLLLGVVIACQGLLLVADYLAIGRDPTLLFSRILGGLLVAGRAVWSLRKAGFLNWR